VALRHHLEVLPHQNQVQVAEVPHQRVAQQLRVPDLHPDQDQVAQGLDQEVQDPGQVQEVDQDPVLQPEVDQVQDRRKEVGLDQPNAADQDPEKVDQDQDLELP